MMIHTWDILRPVSMALKMDRFSIALPQKAGLPTSSIYKPAPALAPESPDFRLIKKNN